MQTIFFDIGGYLRYQCLRLQESAVYQIEYSKTRGQTV